MAETQTPQGERTLAGYSTDQVGEWVAVLESILENESHPYRIVKLCEVVEALRANRYRLVASSESPCYCKPGVYTPSAMCPTHGAFAPKVGP